MHRAGWSPQTGLALNGDVQVERMQVIRAQQPGVPLAPAPRVHRPFPAGTLGSPRHTAPRPPPPGRGVAGARLRVMPSWDLSILQAASELRIPIASLCLGKLSPTSPDEQEPAGVDPPRSPTRELTASDAPDPKPKSSGPRPRARPHPRLQARRGPSPTPRGAPAPRVGAGPARGLARRGDLVPAAAGGRAEVPEELTAQGDHKVAQQQEEAAAAPPRHLRGHRGGCSRRLRVPAAGAREAERGPLNFWGGRGGEAPGAVGGVGMGGRGGDGREGPTPKRRQLLPAWGALGAGCLWQVFPSPGMGGGMRGLGLSFLGGSGWERGVGRGSRRRCRLGPKEGAGGGEERKGSGGGPPPPPRRRD